MELKTKIKKFGNSAVILLTKETMEVNELKVGDVVSIDVQLSGPQAIKESKEKKQ